MSEEQDKTGAQGRTLTMMRPSGKVLIESIEYGDRLKSGWADAGEEEFPFQHQLSKAERDGYTRNENHPKIHRGLTG